MSLNRYEQIMFDYWDKEPDERRHWQTKVAEAARNSAEPGGTARALERDLWDYYVERAQHVPHFREPPAGSLRRVSLLNLADHLLRVWGPPPKSRKSSGQSAF